MPSFPSGFLNLGAESRGLGLVGQYGKVDKATVETRKIGGLETGDKHLEESMPEHDFTF